MRIILILFLLLSCQKELRITDYRKTQKDSIKKYVLDSIKTSDTLGNKLGTVKFSKKKIVLYDNYRWEYKGISTAKAQPYSQPQKFLQSIPKPVREIETGRSSYKNGTCGYPTKSGHPCRRRVKGGGTCWQHSN